MSEYRTTGGIFATTLMVLVLSACGTQTASIDRVARARDLPNAPYSNILVIGVAPDAGNGRRFENAMAAELSSDRTQARPNHREMGGDTLSEAIVRESASGMGADGILITSVKRVQTGVEVTNERVDVDKERRPGGLIDFFRYDYREYREPPEVGSLYDVVLVSDFYDAQSGERVYTVESSTMKATSAFEVIVAESVAISRRLRRDGIVR